ncbi:MAG: DUF1206 domain-containing protein [Acidimicrobiia bacterium]
MPTRVARLRDWLKELLVRARAWVTKLAVRYVPDRVRRQVVTAADRLVPREFRRRVNHLGRKLLHPEMREHVELAARIGLAAQGVLYLVVGLLAVQLVVSGQSVERTSTRGALETVAHQPLGRGLVAVMALGCAAHALWRLARAVHPGGKGTKRLADAGRAVVYLVLTGGAARVFFGANQTGTGRQQRITEWVMGIPGGVVLVAGAGLVVMGVGAWQFRNVITAKFLRKIDQPDDERWRRVIETVGRTGYLGRGIAFCLVGGFLFSAGVRHDASDSDGLDDVLNGLVTDRTWLIVLVAGGLFAFGAYRLVDAVLRRPNAT